MRAFLAAGAAPFIAMPGTAFAQQAAQAETMAYAIPAGSLAGSLAAFARTSGVRIAYSAELARGKAAPALNGRFTRADALSRILAGSGLSYGFSGANTVTISGPAAQVASGVAPADGSTVLDTITVTSGGGVAPADVPYSSAGSSAYISGEEVDRRRGSSPGDLFSGIPGVINGETRNSGAVDVNIRGLQGQGRAPVVIDGASQEVTVYRGYNGSQARTYVDPDFIGGVAIEKGPSAGADATGATGGVVRMSTITAKDILAPGQTQGVRLKTGFNSNSSATPPTGTDGLTRTGQDDSTHRPSALLPTGGNGSVAAAKTSEHFDLVGAYARRSNGNYHAGTKGYSPTLGTFLPGEEVLNTSQSTESWLLKGTARFGDGHSLELGYTKYLSDYGEALSTQIWGGAMQSHLNSLDLDTYTARYRWKPEDNDLIDLKADLFRTEVDLRINNLTKGATNGIMSSATYATTTNRWGVTLSNTSRFDTDFGDFAWTYGGAFTREDTRPGAALFQPRYGNREEWSGFTSLEWKPVDWLAFSPSLRYSRSSFLDRNVQSFTAGGDMILGDPITDASGGLSPLASVTIEPLDGVQVYAKAGSALRSPSIFETHNGASFATSYAINPVDPERNRSMEFGVNLMRDGVFAAGDKLRFHAGYFDNYVENYITRISEVVSGWERLSRVNLDHAEMRGFEISAEYDTGKYFGGIAWNHYTHTMFCAPPGMQLPTRPTCSPGGIYNSYSIQQVPPQNTVTANIGGRFFDDRLTLGSRMTYVGRRITDDWGAGSGGGSGGLGIINPSKWDPYLLFDLSATYKPNENVTMSFSVDNVTDRYYVDALDSGINVPAPGRTFRFDLTVKPTVDLIGGDAFFGEGGPSGRDGAQYDWNGFFVGLNSGYDWASTSGKTANMSGIATANAASESANLDLSDFGFGLQAGYNRQFSNGFIAGFEAELARATASGSQASFATEAASLAANSAFQAVTDYEFDWSATARAKVGYGFDRLMVYGSAGVSALHETQTRRQYTAMNVVASGSSPSLYGTTSELYFSEQAKAIRLGATLGAGLEYALSDRWSIKADYEYTRFKTESFEFEQAREGMLKPASGTIRCTASTRNEGCPPTGNGTFPISVSGDTAANVDGRKAENTLQFHSLKLGLNYRF